MLRVRPVLEVLAGVAQVRQQVEARVSLEPLIREAVAVVVCGQITSAAQAVQVS